MDQWTATGRTRGRFPRPGPSGRADRAEWVPPLLRHVPVRPAWEHVGDGALPGEEGEEEDELLLPAQEEEPLQLHLRPQSPPVLHGPGAQVVLREQQEGEVGLLRVRYGPVSVAVEVHGGEWAGQGEGRTGRTFSGLRGGLEAQKEDPR